MILTAPKLSSSSPRKVPFEPFSVLKIISMNAENNAVSNYLSFLKFFLHFWLFPYIFLSSPGCFTLKSWVFWVHSNYVFCSPKKLKISVFSIQVHWENCKLTTKNARKTEENIRLLTALFSAFIKIFCGRKMARKEQLPLLKSGFFGRGWKNPVFQRLESGNQEKNWI